jgi:hypothetical protein
MGISLFTTTLMHGATTHQFFDILGFINVLYFFVMLVCGVKKFKTFQVFLKVLLMCRGNNHKLHDLCACVDV